MKTLNLKQQSFQIATIFVLILIAFVQCYKTAHDLTWTVEADFDRDQSFVQGILDGTLGHDPSYQGEYLWYNPLLSVIESVIVKITHLPVNIVLARAGIYLNILAPITFVILCFLLFNIRIAVAALASFLFFSTGNLPSWSSATLSPWLYPGGFMQFIFYLNVAICYVAYSRQSFLWFGLLGVMTGISFLGHTAPTLMIILILVSLQSKNIITAYKQKDRKLIYNYLLQGAITFSLFVMISFPFLLLIIGKYNLHIINRISFELTQGNFNWFYFKYLIFQNMTISSVIAVFGMFAFFKYSKNMLVNRIILNWFVISITVFLYTTFIGAIRMKYGIQLPGFVPSFHFHFYMKALQSVFFGYGFVVIFKYSLAKIHQFKLSKQLPDINEKVLSNSYVIIILLLVTLYYPVYSNRQDFKSRQIAIDKANDKDKVEIYNWILENVPSYAVILCPHKLSNFPVMATGRKLVSTNLTFSNPYIDFDSREKDRNTMLGYLKTGYPDSAKFLFQKYDATVLLVYNDSIKGYNNLKSQFNTKLFSNATYSIFLTEDKTQMPALSSHDVFTETTVPK